ncbi:MAG: hypothetical protein WCL34_08150 [Methylococcaceae bacterium]|jgi:predicted DNA-binding protein
MKKNTLTISTRVTDEFNNKLEAIAEVLGCTKSVLLLRMLQDELPHYEDAARMLMVHKMQHPLRTQGEVVNE